MLGQDHTILAGLAADQKLALLPAMATRHGLITGATGTGKTITLQTLAEGFSEMGVPVFLADIKGDLSGLAKAGQPKGKIASRIDELQLPQLGYVNKGFPVAFWDVFAEQGLPLRATISDLGPLLLGRLLKLNSVQSALLHSVFRIADDHGWLLLDLKDLQSLLAHLSENEALYRSSYGNLPKQSLGAIQRGLLELEAQGAAQFFGEPALALSDLLLTDAWGHGVINILEAQRLANHAPKTYACLLLWLLSKLFEDLPECGDLPKPKLVFFFDEAHLLFDHAEAALLEKIEQVVRLIRSRGVALFFISQSPADIPDSVLGQLQNRVQHALRAFTPKERKAVKCAAEAFRPNPALDTSRTIEELGVGMALVSFLDEKGVPRMVEKAAIIPPQSQAGPLENAELTQIIQQSPLQECYAKTLDRYSAYEMLAEKAQIPAPKPRTKAQDPDPLEAILGSFAKKAGQQLTNQIARNIGRKLARGILGTLFGGKGSR
ncbi:MAG: DUF853 domain-containing protein [Desulfovibrio sp.]|nr:DUF853 domain-containing protein [Desulfovibrio sp.]